MRVIDLFCGCGGLSLGFQNAGFNIVSAYDNWTKAIEIYNENFKHKAIQIDINNLKSEDLINLNPDLIIGGPPCQDYSSAGKRDESQGRANLTLKYAEIIRSVRPKWFVMENVDRILKSKTYYEATKIFKNANYGLTQVVLDASKCGVPQIRKRCFLIGELNGQDDFLKNELLKNISSKSLTIREYLGNEIDVEYYYRHPRSYSRRGIFSIDEPSPTIRGVNRPLPSSYICHSGDKTTDLSIVRALTSFERARIQTFPKYFKFGNCNKTDLEQIIGNAVPVKLAEYVAMSLKNYIQKNI